jgi:phosphoglycolate phosphatase
VSQLFPGIFDIVLGEREGIPRKPDPQIVYDIIHRLSPTLSQSPILYIGDSSVDAHTARAAADQLPVKLVLCTWGFSSTEEMKALQPDFLVDHPSEILPILANE